MVDIIAIDASLDELSGTSSTCLIHSDDCQCGDDCTCGSDTK